MSQRVETFTQKTFIFRDTQDRLLGVRTINRIANTLPAWLRASRVRLVGLSPLFLAAPVLAAPARVESLRPQMTDPDTGRTGVLPEGYDPENVEEHSTCVTIFGNIVSLDQEMPQQRIGMFTQLDYSFVDKSTGQTLATRQHGRIATAIEAWAEANDIVLRGLGHLYIRNPPDEVPYGDLDQARLVNPRTKKVEPYVVENPDQVTVLEYMTVQPVFGDVAPTQPDKSTKPNQEGQEDVQTAEPGDGE